MTQVKQTFRPEFLGRVDELVLMRGLNEEDGRRIAELMLGKIVQRLAKRGVMLEYDESVPLLLARLGVDCMSGARNLRRVIARHVADPLSDLLLRGDIASGKITLSAEGEEIRINTSEAAFVLT